MTVEPIAGHLTGPAPTVTDWHMLTVQHTDMNDAGRVQYIASCSCGEWDSLAVGLGVAAARFVTREHDQHRRNVT